MSLIATILAYTFAAAQVVALFAYRDASLLSSIGRARTLVLLPALVLHEMAHAVMAALTLQRVGFATATTIYDKADGKFYTPQVMVLWTSRAAMFPVAMAPLLLGALGFWFLAYGTSLEALNVVLGWTLLVAAIPSVEDFQMARAGLAPFALLVAGFATVILGVGLYAGQGAGDASELFALVGQFAQKAVDLAARANSALAQLTAAWTV